MKDLLRYLFPIAFLLFSCNQNHTPIRSGKIVYQLDYPEIKEKSPFAYEILPKQMSFLFNESHSKTRIKNGLISFTSITDNMNKQWCCVFNDGDQKSTILDYKEFNTIFPDNYYEPIFDQQKETEIAGFKAKSLLMHLDQDTIEVWYTNDIMIPNAQWETPFRHVPGVLLQYSFHQYGLKMKCKASKFEEIDDFKETEFLPPSDAENQDYHTFVSNFENLFAQL